MDRSPDTGLFKEIDFHIQNDMSPSNYFNELDPTRLKKHPFHMLIDLNKIEQSPKFHPEGNVWNHTMLVLDEAALRRKQASDSRVFMWAALLHDIGKAVTTRRRNGKITAYDHDKAGAGMAHEFLSEFESEPFISKVRAIVRWHMQILYVMKSMHLEDLAAMKKESDVNDIALLGICDRLGRINIDREAEEKNISIFLSIAENSLCRKDSIMAKDSQLDPKDVRKRKAKGGPTMAESALDGESRNTKKQSGNRNHPGDDKTKS